MVGFNRSAVLKYKHYRVYAGGSMLPDAPDAEERLAEIFREFDVLDRCQSLFLAGKTPRLRGGNVKDFAYKLKYSTNIYFVLADEANAVKIGRTDNLSARMSALKTDSAVPIRLVSSVRAPHVLESYLHALHKESRIRGEWFRCEGAVLEMMNAAADSGLRGVVDIALRMQNERKTACAASG